MKKASKKTAAKKNPVRKNVAKPVRKSATKKPRMESALKEAVRRIETCTSQILTLLQLQHFAPSKEQGFIKREYGAKDSYEPIPEKDHAVARSADTKAIE
jgi:hypothetical protein